MQQVIENPYARLAHARRRRRQFLRADELLPGDEIELDGGCWTLQASVVLDEAVRLVLVPNRWEPTVERCLMVRVLRGT
jgi:hypothetical protein